MIGFSENVIDWLQTIIFERFGYQFQLMLKTSRLLDLRLLNESGWIRFDTLVPGFFAVGADLPCGEWNAENENFKSILGNVLPTPGFESSQSPMIEKNNKYYVIHYDIFGMVYWMLSRQEEVERADLDVHGRFPATSSHAHKYDYLDFPVVDEWLDILAQVLLRQWPHLKLKKHQPLTRVSCDLDKPYLFHSKSLKAMLMVSLVDILKKRKFTQALTNIHRYFKWLCGSYDTDPYIRAIDWIMDVNEEVGNKVAFYFIADQRDPVFDSYYSMNEPVIRFLIQRISLRGHEIGLHTSYTTYQNSKQTENEAKILRQVMKEENLKPVEMGGRQHYLRWETPTTALNWENAGMTYDSTLCYADRPGFRCGTCHEFPMFNPVQGIALKLRQRPLILMERSVISKAYMGLGYSEEALIYMQELKLRCHKSGGIFTFLWHNSHFNTEQDKDFYRALIG